MMEIMITFEKFFVQSIKRLKMLNFKWSDI